MLKVKKIQRAAGSTAAPPKACPLHLPPVLAAVARVYNNSDYKVK